ncbi:glutamyl-tRNA synthetase [Belliella buryatensis]|uniref:Glutamyl-tRNA synthetase n=1 Tax=Belliella buryatensis TaxID=1500549 RepID=A0A239CZT1_9BACT|nr:glutamate--tRNA ligase family protein [Belliella buryatensis]SNS25725.1 glutamyl-tRNA synthetase [Belliella buryatensis]
MITVTLDKHHLTRYAPTPSGFLHLGNVFSFLNTYHLAKASEAKILLRIDDYDQERVKKKYIQDIFDTLDFLEIPFDSGPKTLKEFESKYSSKHRKVNYTKALEILKSKNMLFACDCSRKKVERMHPKGFYTGYCQKRNLDFNLPEINWRTKLPFHHPVQIKTTDGWESGKTPGILNDIIVKKKDGLPSYQLASVVDDLTFGIDLIVRGKDLWGSSLAQIHIARHLGINDFGQSTFHHHQLIKNTQNRKLSKSAGDTSIQFLRKSGKKKTDVFRLLADQLGIKQPIESIEDFSNYCLQK